MKHFILVIIGVLFYLIGHSQEQIFVLHHLVGDTIDKNEKLKYLLFPEIDVADFDYCYLITSKGDYFIKTHTQTKSVNIQKTDTTSINQNIRNINKLEAYFAHKDSYDTLLRSNQNLQLNTPMVVTTPLIDNESKVRIRKEVRRDARLKNDAERSKNKKMGTGPIGDGVFVEF
jgi:hypothetical protein